MKVLSLFDGISCGMVALERAGIPVERYVAYEIEPNAIKISKKNWPDIEHCGDVTTADFTQYAGFDLLIGGSPCQSLSIVRSQTRQHLDGKSKLFFEFVRAMEEVKPKYFLFENVASMNNESYTAISRALGCAGILINSKHFSAQERPRFYWTNIDLDLIPTNKTVLKDILQPESDIPEEFYYSAPLLNVDMQKQVCATLDIKINQMHRRVFNPEFKCHTLTCVSGGNQQKKVLVNGRCRKLTPVEYERLQTLPDNYTAGVSNGARYTAIGNGWTVDVITHILSSLKNERNKTMKLEITELQVPGKIGFNYEELKTELTERLKEYSVVVYTEDQIAEAKKDRADLNRLKKALNDERIRQEKEFMKPFDEFKGQVKELCTIIDKASATVDAQVKAFEDQQKADKFESIKTLAADISFPVQLEKVMDQKWLNASVSLKAVKEALEAKKETILSEMQVIDNLPAYSFEAKQFYLNTLDLAATMREVNRLQEQAEAKAKWFEQQEAMKKAKEAEPVNVEPEQEEAVERQWIGFQAFLSIDEAKALGQFLKSNGIQYKAI